MHASPFDFVSALSAEESCPLCSERYATVDQCACVACGTNTCPDCASLRPDASWICASCVVHSPGMAVVPGTDRGTPVWQRVRKLHIALTQRALFRPGASAAQPSVSDRLQTLRSSPRARLGLLLSTWLRLWASFGSWLAQRMEQARAQQLRLGSVLRRQHRLQRARARYLFGSVLITLRSLQWRQHASSLLVATVILIAVARSQTSPDGR